MTFLEFNNKFPSEKEAIDYFLHIRYKDILTCPHCSATVKVYRCRKRAKVWSILKRAWIGTYHHYSVKYMKLYVDEVCFRQNNRENGNVFEILLCQSVLKKVA